MSPGCRTHKHLTPNSINDHDQSGTYMTLTQQGCVFQHKYTCCLLSLCKQFTTAKVTNACLHCTKSNHLSIGQLSGFLSEPLTFYPDYLICMHWAWNMMLMLPLLWKQQFSVAWIRERRWKRSFGILIYPRVRCIENLQVCQQHIDAGNLFLPHPKGIGGEML